MPSCSARRIAWTLSLSVSRSQTGSGSGLHGKGSLYCHACVYPHIDNCELIKDFCTHRTIDEGFNKKAASILRGELSKFAGFALARGRSLREVKNDGRIGSHRPGCVRHLLRGRSCPTAFRSQVDSHRAVSQAIARDLAGRARRAAWAERARSRPFARVGMPAF